MPTGCEKCAGITGMPVDATGRWEHPGVKRETKTNPKADMITIQECLQSAKLPAAD